LRRFSPRAAELEAAEAERAEDFKRLGRLLARCRLEQTKLEVERDTLSGEIAVKDQTLEDARARERTLQGEVLFLEKTAADRRFSDAKAELERANVSLATSSRRLRAARAADISRRFTSAQHQQQELDAELERIEHDLAPDRARLARAGANLHALLEQLAVEADRDAETHERLCAGAQHEAEHHEQDDRAATARSNDRKAEVTRLAERVAEHDRERKELEHAGALQAAESPSAALARIGTEIARHDDAIADVELRDEQRQTESRELEGVHSAAVAESRRCAEAAERLAKFGAAGRALEQAILDSTALAEILAGDTKDPYRADLPERARAARTLREEALRRLGTERAGIAEELAFLDAEGVSSAPADVMLLARTLKEAGFHDAQPAEHYLAQFKPKADEALALLRNDPARFGGVFVARLDSSRLTPLAADRRLKLKGPVIVSEATLQPSSVAAAQAGIVFGPLSAARVNKQAAAEERAELMAALARKETELGECQAQVEVIRNLIDHLRDLHSTYAEERPDAALRRAEILRTEKEQADQRARNALARQKLISDERAQFRTRLRDLADAISRLKMAKQAIEQFARRYAGVAEMAARIPIAETERQREEAAARTARAARCQGPRRGGSKSRRCRKAAVRCRSATV